MKSPSYGYIVNNMVSELWYFNLGSSTATQCKRVPIMRFRSTKIPESAGLCKQGSEKLGLVKLRLQSKLDVQRLHRGGGGGSGLLLRNLI